MWWRTIPIWEGFTRSALSLLAIAVSRSETLMRWPKPFAISLERLVSASRRLAFGNRLKQEVQTGCEAKCRGKPALIQRLARCILEAPDHRGVGTALTLLHGFIKDEDTDGERDAVDRCARRREVSRWPARHPARVLPRQTLNRRVLSSQSPSPDLLVCPTLDYRC